LRYAVCDGASHRGAAQRVFARPWAYPPSAARHGHHASAGGADHLRLLRRVHGGGAWYLDRPGLAGGGGGGGGGGGASGAWAVRGLLPAVAVAQPAEGAAPLARQRDAALRRSLAAPAVRGGEDRG